MNSLIKKTINKHDLTIAKKTTVTFFEEKSDNKKISLSYDFGIKKWELLLVINNETIYFENNLTDKQAINQYNKYVQKYFL